MKIKGITVGTTMPRSDWNQTNPAKADFIKNKPVPDTTLSKSGMAADAKVTGGRIRGAEENIKALQTGKVSQEQHESDIVGLQTGKVPVGLYTRDTFWVDSLADPKTPTFWEQIIDIFDSMPVGTVEHVHAIVVHGYGSVDSNEPSGGGYRVTITKYNEKEYGLVEAVNYNSSASSLNGPLIFTRIKKNGEWLDTQYPVANIYEHIRRELLWYNASPSSKLEGTKIPVGEAAKKYNALLILVNLNHDRHYTIPVLIKDGGSSNGGMAYFPANYTKFHAEDGYSWTEQWRYFWWTGDKTEVVMNNVNGSASEMGASRCIPIKVYGLNL